MIVGKRCLVAGRVQGVFYRASTQQQAQRLSLSGCAKNLPDGRVEVLVIGEPSQVDLLVEWLWQGPPASHVTHVEVQTIATADFPQLQDRFVTA
jgi:acylphosphatase